MEKQEGAKTDNIKVKLSMAEAHILNSIISIKIEKKNDEYFIIGKKSFYIKLLDELSDKFSDIGLDINDNPNELGLKLESLIDKFSPIVYV